MYHFSVLRLYVEALEEGKETDFNAHDLHLLGYYGELIYTIHNIRIFHSIR